MFSTSHGYGIQSNKISLDKPYSNKGVKCECVLTLHWKIDSCKQLEKGEKHTDLIGEYNVGSTIYDTEAQEEQLFRFC